MWSFLNSNLSKNEILEIIKSRQMQLFIAKAKKI